MHTSVITMLCNKEMTKARLWVMPLQSHVLHSGLQLLMNNISAIVAKIPPKVFTFFVLWVSSVERQRITPSLYVGYI